jgi:hypothetical protein
MKADMENVIISFEDKNPPSFFKSVGVVGGIVGGLILMVTGLFLSATAYFRQTSFRGIEMLLFLGSLALLTIGAHSLDLIERDKKARRIALCEGKSLRIDDREKGELTVERFR